MRKVRARKADPNFLTIDSKQDLTGALYVNVSFSDGDFSIFYVVSTNETNMFEIQWLLKGSEMSAVARIKFRDLMLNVTFIWKG